MKNGDEQSFLDRAVIYLKYNCNSPLKVRGTNVYQAMDADSLKNLYRRLYADVPLLPPLTSKAGIPSLDQMPSGLSDYDALLERGCGT